MWEHVIAVIIQVIDTIFIYINGLVYDFISFLYQIFIALAGAQIFTSAQYQEIANRIYVIIGVVSLFLISYGLLRAIIDPDGAAKTDYSAKKIIPNVIKVVMFIGLTPVVFAMAYKIQDIVINTDVIPKIIFDENYGSGGEDGYTYDESGREFANSIFTSFLYVKDYEEPENVSINSCYFPAPDCNGIQKDAIEQLEDSWEGNEDIAYSFAEAVKEVNSGKKNFQVYANFGSKMHGENKVIEYNPIFQLIAGIIVIYVILNYCIDLGVRAIKLGYYQIIAPIPILSILIPGQNKVFNNWLKATISTFVDVFFRIAVFFLGLLAIKLLPSVGASVWANSSFATNTSVQNFARVFLIIGILIFIKQAPKLLSDIFGIQGGAFKLGIKDKLGEMVGANTAKDVIARPEGAITGGLGAGWTAKMNGMKFKDGFKYGMYNGWKGKGNQFNAQRQGIYTKAFDGDGKAAFFGKGRAYFDKKGAQINKETKNAYREQNFARVLGYEESEEFKREYRTIYNKQQSDITIKTNEYEMKKQNREQGYTDEINSIKSNIASAEAAATTLKEKQAVYDAEVQKFEAAKQQQKEMAQMEYERAVEKGDSVAQLAASTRLKQIEDEKYVNANLTSEINDLKLKSENLGNLQAQLHETEDRFKNDPKLAEYDRNLESLSERKKNLDDEYDYFNGIGRYADKKRTYETERKRDDFYALQEARSSFERTHADYHDVIRTHTNNLAEESNAAYVHSKEGQRQSAVFRDAMKGFNNGSSGGGSDKKK